MINLASITVADCEVDSISVNGIKTMIIKTPACSAADTLDVSSWFGERAIAWCSSATGNTDLCVGSQDSDLSITIPSGPSSEVCRLYLTGK